MNRYGAIAYVLLGLGLLTAATIPVVARSLRNARATSCANNLSQLWKMENNYRVQIGHSYYPLETGDAFWLKLSRPPTKLIDESLADVYQCPVEDFRDEGCDYRGPSGNANRYDDGAPVGADVDGNHGEGKGGNVLRRSGDVTAAGPGDEIWALAARHTSGGNRAQPRDREGELRAWGLGAAFAMLLLLGIVKIVQVSRGVPARNGPFVLAVAGLLVAMLALWYMRILQEA